MPKYNVAEVIEIIKSLSSDEKIALQQVIPELLNLEKSVEKLLTTSQSISGITIGDQNSSLEFNQILADRGSGTTQSRSQLKAHNADLHATLDALKQLHNQIDSSNVLSLLEKQIVAVPLKTLATELTKEKPDQTLVEQAIAALRKGLAGVETLAEPVKRVANLVAQAWTGV